MWKGNTKYESYWNITGPNCNALWFKKIMVAINLSTTVWTFKFIQLTYKQLNNHFESSSCYMKMTVELQLYCTNTNFRYTNTNNKLFQRNNHLSGVEGNIFLTTDFCKTLTKLTCRQFLYSNYLPCWHFISLVFSSGNCENVNSLVHILWRLSFFNYIFKMCLFFLFVILLTS